MDEGKIFSIAFVTYNEQKRTGGEWIELNNCVKHNHLTPSELKSKANAPREKVFRNPNHYQNVTRNIKRMDTGDLIKIHLRLVCKFNGKTVL